MLTQLVLKLDLFEGKPLHHNQGSLFHGWLIDRLSSDQAELLHDRSMKPFSQWVLRDKEKSIWVINTLNEQTREWLIDPLLKAKCGTISLKSSGQELSWEVESLQDITYDQLVERFVLTNQRRITRVKFCTPTSFKVQGEYLNIPVIRNVFSSLVMRFDMYSDALKVGEELSPESFDQYIHLKDYRLRSTRYHLESVKIPAFVGECDYLQTGPQPMVNVITMLLQFARYSGIGMKTALGMGGIQVSDRKGESKSEPKIGSV